MFAIARIGAIWVPVNTQAVGDNLAYVLATPRRASSLPKPTSCRPSRPAAPSSAVRNCRAPGDALCRPDSAPSPGDDRSSVGRDAPFAIMYTSGTTGRPKGVLVSHRMLRLVRRGGGAGRRPRAPATCSIVWEPLFHIGGAQMIVLPLIRDVTLALAERFSAQPLLGGRAARAAPRHMHFLGGILQILLKQPPGPLDRSAWRAHRLGRRLPARRLASRSRQRFGVQIRECYGMTECSSFTTANLDGPSARSASPCPGSTSLSSISAGSRSPPATGARWSCAQRLPGALTRGYFKDPEATARPSATGPSTPAISHRCDAAGQSVFPWPHDRQRAGARRERDGGGGREDVARKHPAVEDCAMIGVAAEVGEAGDQALRQAASRG